MCGHILQFVHALFANNVSSLRGKGIEGSNAGHGVLRRTSSERTFLPPWCHHLAARFLKRTRRFRATDYFAWFVI